MIYISCYFYSRLASCRNKPFILTNLRVVISSLHILKSKLSLLFPYVAYPPSDMFIVKLYKLQEFVDLVLTILIALFSCPSCNLANRRLLLLVLRIKEIRPNNLKSFLISPISHSMSLLSRAPMLALRWRGKVGVVALEKNEDVAMKTGFRRWSGRLVCYMSLRVILAYAGFRVYEKKREWK